ncbi:ABC transporter substrate-binding protein [Adhaeribacter soli]|uniref:ABC transporter substrate-binding protein n=1 Tax=Adhaeribacter soli TaxID=2607655 RepID=A0A5N1IY30_9BACT|nr:ABC transporter substrate-binding protein [Adhaeribacter soli]KAA9339018.1 ABC transporter substrate-binding protein [Adhaeribacter soli]
MHEIKIGVLLCRSTLYPTISADIFTGIKAGLKQFGLGNAKVIMENVGFGGVEDEVYAKAEKLVLQEEVQLLIAFLDHFAAVKLDSLVNNSGCLLLVLDPGGNVPVESQAAANRFTLSLQAALGSRISGKMAAGNNNPKSIFATSFYEGGYLGCYAFVRGLEKSGGSVCYNDVIPFRFENYNPQLIRQAIEQQQPFSVLAQFSAEAGGIFLKEFAALEAHQKTRLFVSPFLLEESWLATQPFLFENIEGCTVWSEELDLPENKLFLETMQQAGKKGNIFSLLGWEAGQFCSRVTEINGDAGNWQPEALEKLSRLTFNSPRGPLTPHPESHYFISPMYRAKVVAASQTNTCKLEVLGEVENIGQEWQEFLADLPESTFSRWTNTYLCL